MAAEQYVLRRWRVRKASSSRPTSTTRKTAAWRAALLDYAKTPLTSPQGFEVAMKTIDEIYSEMKRNTPAGPACR